MCCYFTSMTKVFTVYGNTAGPWAMPGIKWVCKRSNKTFNWVFQNLCISLCVTCFCYCHYLLECWQLLRTPVPRFSRTYHIISVDVAFRRQCRHHWEASELVHHRVQQTWQSYCTCKQMDSVNKVLGKTS